MNYGLAARRSMGAGLAHGTASGATPWYRAGGAPAPIAAYQAIGVADLATSKINLVSPGTYDAFAGTNPTHASATGQTYNGSSQYLKTGIVPAANYTLIVAFSGATGSDSHCIAGLSATGSGIRFYLRARNGGANHLYGYGSSSRTVAGALTSGVMAIAGTACYLDGVSDGTITASWNNTTQQIYIGADCAANGAPQYYAPVTIRAIAIYSTNADHAIWVPAVSVAMAALTG